MFRPIYALALQIAVLCPPAIASSDHDHGQAAPPAAPVLPRVAASSELFELVGVANGKQLTVYLDRFADNGPVKGAKLELEVGGVKVALKQTADGEFEGALAQRLPEGRTSVTATVTAGNETDLLAGDFDVYADGHTAVATLPWWRRPVAWAVAGILVLLALTWATRRSFTARRQGGAS